MSNSLFKSTEIGVDGVKRRDEKGSKCYMRGMNLIFG